MMDAFWISKVQEYTSLFNLFCESISKELNMDDVVHLWAMFREEMCDCEGCREDSDCTIHVSFDDSDYTE